jgi:hypothetical protein
MKNIDSISAKEYARAFREIDGKIGEIGRKLLRAALEIPEYTREDLAEAVGLKSGCAANLLFGTFAHAVADRVGVIAPKHNGRTYWMLVLEYEPYLLGSNGHTAYCLRDAVVQALRPNVQ